jgi:hypothetical protein
MEKLLLVSVFWESREEEDGEDAIVHIEDGVVVYITRPDGLEVRLLITELEHVYYFALEQVHRWEEDDAGEVLESGRMEGCESTNHMDCYGDLWQCGKCGKTVCSNEGTDNDPDLCDDCWAEKYSPRTTLCQPEDEVPF